MFQGKNKAEKLKIAKNLFNDSVQADQKFQKDAMEDFEFIDDNQWDDGDKQYLLDNLRPCLTFNLIHSRVKLVMGMHEDSKVKYVASPREQTDGFLCEVLNDVVDYIYEKAETVDVEDSAFESAVICGRGWVGISFVPDPRRLGYIKLQYDKLPIYEVHKDPASRRDILTDAGYIFHDRWLNQEDFKLLHPQHARHFNDILETGKMGSSSLSEFGSEDAESDFDDVIDVDRQDYDIELDVSYFNLHKRQIRVVQMEYWENFKRYYTFHPETGERIEFQKTNMKELKQTYLEDYGIDFEYITMTDQKVKWLQFIGDKIVYDDDSPIPFDGFSVVQCVAYSDASGRTTNDYGVTRPLKDPQREVNKRWSQALNMINNNVQPGVIVEENTFVDDDQGQDSLKTVGGVTMVKEDALKDKRIEVLKPPPFPVAAMQMEEAAKSMLNEISGINPELMGQDRGRVESGPVIRLRQQQALSILKTLMDASKRLKKGDFERTIAIVMEYMPDEQLVDILGDSERYVIEGNVITDVDSQLSADIRDVRSVKFNVKSEAMPASGSRRILELSIFMEMQKEAGIPVDPKVLIDKTDLSASDKKRWNEYIQAQQEAAQKDKADQLELEKMKIQAKMFDNQRKLEATTALGVGKLEEGIRKGDMKDSIERGELALKNKEINLDFIAATQKEPEEAKSKSSKPKPKKK